MFDFIARIFQPGGDERMQNVTSDEEWDACLARSHEVPILVLKHSTRCGISAAAYGRVLRYLEEHSEAPETFLVKVVENRPVSNRIAKDMGVIHRSPQMLLICDGESKWDASHHGINAGSIAEALEHEIVDPSDA